MANEHKKHRINLRLRSYIVMNEEEIDKVNLSWVFEKASEILSAPENISTHEYISRQFSKRKVV